MDAPTRKRKHALEADWRSRVRSYFREHGGQMVLLAIPFGLATCILTAAAFIFLLLALGWIGHAIPIGWHLVGRWGFRVVMTMVIGGVIIGAGLFSLAKLGLVDDDL